MLFRSIDYISLVIEDHCKELGHALSVEEIQELVETHIILQGAPETAKRYIRYRFTRNLVRESNTTDNKILSLIERNNEEAKQENSNKNPVINSTQRDYMAGEVSRDLSARILLPKDIVKAHQEGLIHFHDSDYYAQHMHNCDLVNLEDMLQNGTVITGTLIEKHTASRPPAISRRRSSPRSRRTSTAASRSASRTSPRLCRRRAKRSARS